MRRLLIPILLLFAALPAMGGDAAELVRIESKVMNETRSAIVRLPPTYMAGSRSYPVLYITDGDWQMFHTAATADFLARQGRMPEVIIVGIINTDRTRDLTPTHVASTVVDGLKYEFPTSGGAGKFLDFISNELIPTIDAKYRTTPFRIFAGHSFGGLFALYAMLERPKLFKAWIAVSPSFDWDDNYLARRGAEVFGKGSDLHGSLVITLGNEGPALDQGMSEFQRLLSASAPKTLEWNVVKFDDEDHGSVIMPSQYAGFRKVFTGWRYTLPVKSDAQTLYAEAKAHYDALSERFGYTIGIPENLLNLIGYRLLSSGRKEDAVEIFRKNVEAYPGSPNVYDSLGEALESSGRLREAKDNYAKAVSIARKLSEPSLEIYKRNHDRVARALGQKPITQAPAPEL